MEIWIVRHGDPDYEHDSITDKGVREAKLLADRLAKTEFSAVYCSTLGRAQKTASYYLEKTGKTAQSCKWLEEFWGYIKHDGSKQVCWDRMPDYWTKIDEYYLYDKWNTTDLMQSGNAPKRYDYVCTNFEKLLKKHGYEKNGRMFNAVNSNADRILLFCHFGVECVLLSYLFSISPMPLWHNYCALPTSVTRIVSEERKEGKAAFRCLYFGDVSHLYAGGEEPSFKARFCEQFTDETRH